jgi:uncharacterized protein (DUF1697 family)
LARYFAFLRAINVGGRTVRMESLRSAIGTLGFSGVETFIASGNAIFEPCLTNEELLQKIERHLARTLGYEVATFIRSPAELNRSRAIRPSPWFPTKPLAIPSWSHFFPPLSRSIEKSHRVPERNR